MHNWVLIKIEMSVSDFSWRGHDFFSRELVYQVFFIQAFNLSTKSIKNYNCCFRAGITHVPVLI